MEHKTILMAGMIMALVANGVADSITATTYAQCYDRAGALLPGLTTLERDLARNEAVDDSAGGHHGDLVARMLMREGAWEIAGGAFSFNFGTGLKTDLLNRF